MTADHRYGQEDCYDLEDKKPGSSEEHSLDGPDENGSIFLDCIDATAAEVIEWQLNNTDIVQKQASANKQSEEFGSDQVDDITNAEDDCHEDESMFLDCIEASEEDVSYQNSQLTKADIVQNQTAEKKNAECFLNITDDMADLVDDCNEDERVGSDEMNENYESRDCTPDSFSNKEACPSRDSLSTETKQAQADKTNSKGTRTYGDDTKGELKVRASKRKSEKKGVNNYASFCKHQNKFRDTYSLGWKRHRYSKSKINARKEKRQSIGTSTCPKKIEITVKLEIKVSKYATRNNVSQSGTYSRKTHCNKIAMEDKFMCAGYDQNLNDNMQDWSRKNWYQPDNYLSMKGDEVCYLDLLRGCIPLVNRNFVALPTQPLPPRDSHTWDSQIRSSTLRSDQNGFVYHLRCPCCQYQMIVIAEPSQSYTHGLSVGQYHEFYSSLRTSSNISLLPQREKPVAYVRNSCGLQRPMLETGRGGNILFSKSTAQMSSYGQLSGSSTFSTSYSTNELSTGDPVSRSTQEDVVNEHIRSQWQELGVITDLPSNISKKSSTEMDIRRNDLISEAGQSTFGANAIESVKTTIEQFVSSGQHNNQHMIMQNSSCQTAESELESSSRAIESKYFREESSCDFIGRLHGSTPTVEASPCETKLDENSPVVHSETSPGERNLERNVNTATDAQALREDCTSSQQDFSCGKYDRKERYTSSRRHVPIIVRKDLLLLQEEMIHQSMAASDNNTDCTQEQQSCNSFIRRDSRGSSLTYSHGSQLNIFCDTNDKNNDDFNALAQNNFNPTESVTFGIFTINIFVIKMACVGSALGPNHDAYSMSCPRCRSLVHSSRNVGKTFDENFVKNGYVFLDYVIPVTVTSNHQDMTTIRVAAELNPVNSLQQFNYDRSSTEVVNVSELNSTPKTVQVMSLSSAGFSQVMVADTTSCDSKPPCQQALKMDDQSSAIEHLHRESVLENIYLSYEINLSESDPTRVEDEPATTLNQVEIEPVVQRNQNLPIPEYTAGTPTLPRNGLPCEMEHFGGDVWGNSVSASQKNHNLALPEEMNGDLYPGNCDSLHKQLACMPPENVNEHLSTLIQLERIPVVQLSCPSHELGELGNLPDVLQGDHSHASDDLAERWNELSPSLKQLEHSPVFEGSNISRVSQELAYSTPVRSNQLLSVYEQLNTGSDIRSGCQSRIEPLSNSNIDLPEQLKNVTVVQTTDPVTAGKGFPQDPTIGKDDCLFSSRQTATNFSSGENCPARPQIPSMDVVVQALHENVYSLKTTSEAYKRMQREKTRSSSTDIVEDILAMEDNGKEEQYKSEKGEPNNGTDAGAESTNSDDETASTKPRKTKKGREFLRDATMICCSTLAFVVFLPCGHLMETCTVCAFGLKQCPKCKKIIERIVKPKF